MTTIEKVSCFPNEGTPEVIAGNPAQGDLVRITTTTGAVIYKRYTPPQPPVIADAPVNTSKADALAALDLLSRLVQGM